MTTVNNFLSLVDGLFPLCCSQCFVVKSIHWTDFLQKPYYPDKSSLFDLTNKPQMLEMSVNNSHTHPCLVLAPMLLVLFLPVYQVLLQVNDKILNAKLSYYFTLNCLNTPTVLACLNRSLFKGQNIINLLLASLYVAYNQLPSNTSAKRMFISILHLHVLFLFFTMR